MRRVYTKRGRLARYLSTKLERKMWKACVKVVMASFVYLGREDFFSILCFTKKNQETISLSLADQFK